MQGGNPHHLQDGAQTHSFVVHDAATGEMVHGHKSVILPDVKPPSEKELQAEAVEMAARLTDRPASELGVITVSEDDFEPGFTYSVDLEAGKLVSEPHEKTETESS